MGISGRALSETTGSDDGGCEGSVAFESMCERANGEGLWVICFPVALEQ